MTSPHRIPIFDGHNDVLLRLHMRGGVDAAGELLLEPIRAAFGEFVEGSEERSDVRIVLAALGDRGGAVGAGVTGLEVAGLGMAAYG